VPLSKRFFAPGLDGIVLASLIGGPDTRAIEVGDIYAAARCAKAQAQSDDQLSKGGSHELRPFKEGASYQVFFRGPNRAAFWPGTPTSLSDYEHRAG